MKLAISPLCFLFLSLGLGVAFGQTVVVNGASFDPYGPMAPGSFATVFGQSLCAQTASGQLDAQGNYPTTLGGCSLMVNGMAAMMTYVSPGQMNFVVPQNAGSGSATLAISNGTQTINGSMMIGLGGPGVFSLDGMGMGNGAMMLGTNYRMGSFSTTTNGQPTPVAIFMTGLDLSEKPTMTIGGVALDPANVTFYGNAPGYPGLQQINIQIPANMAGVGRVPVTVTSNGQVSNVTFMDILPTTAMMQGMPGWGSGMMIGEDMPRGAEMSWIAMNPANNTALVTDEAGDVLRVISLSSQTTTATITLPSGSQARSVAVNSAGTLAAVGLTEKGSIALVDLTKNQVVSVIGTGYYACRLAFSGSNLLVSNAASGTVAVIDTTAQQLIRTVNVGFGPGGIAVAGNTAVVANMQGGSISLINLTDYSVTNISLPAGSRPAEVAISTAANKALITNPMWNNAFILSLDTQQIKQVDLAAWSGMGPGGVAVNGTLAYIANQMAANVAVMDLNAGAVIKTFSVDPGTRSLAVNAANNQLLVLCQGTGTLDLVDLGSYAITGRINATSGTGSGVWTLPTVTSISPTSGKIGSTFVLTVNGSNLQAIEGIEFLLNGAGGGGMMGGGTSGGGPGGGGDPNIQVSNLNVSSAGTQVTATIQISTGAAAGPRQLRLELDHWGMMGALNYTVFTVTQ